MTVNGIIFDMDGVIVDSEPFIAQAAIRMFSERYGIRVCPDDFRPFVGAGEDRYLGGVAEKYGIDLELPVDKARTYEIYGRVIQNMLKELPGAKDFIDACRKSELKTALATSADEVKMLANLEEIGVALSSFDVTVNGLEVKRKKPFPDIYIEAADRLELPAARCLVVEDAVNGVKAAKRAGTRCLGITTGFSCEELRRAGADLTAPNLHEVDLDLLLRGGL